MKRDVFLFPGLAGILLAVSSCDKQPGEDAVAVVDGYEITEAEVNHELSKQGIPEAADPNLRRAAVEAIINRRLLADLAVDRELDRTPEFILEEKRMRDMLLAESAMRSIAPESSQSDSAALDALLKSNFAAGQRTLFAVDSLQFRRPEDRTLMQKLRAASSFAEIRRLLDQAEIDASGARLTWDSATISPELFAQVNGLPDGEPFLIEQGEGMLAGVVVDKRRQTLTPEQTRALATAAVAQQKVMERVQNWVTNARLSAEISYGEGYGPQSGQRKDKAEGEATGKSTSAKK